MNYDCFPFCAGRHAHCQNQGVDHRHADHKVAGAHPGAFQGAVMTAFSHVGAAETGGRNGGAHTEAGQGQAKGTLTAHQQEDVTAELDALITKIITASQKDRFAVFSECALEASVWVQQGRLAKPDMVDRFARAAEAYDLHTDYGIDGIQNVLANTLKEAAAIVAAISNGHDNNTFDEMALRQDATLSALPALSASHTGTWADPDWTVLDDRRGELPEFPTETFSTPWQGWLRRAARGAGATEGHVAVPLLANVSSLIGTARRVRASSSWSEPCTMWTAVIGFSGTGKTPGIDVTKRALAQIEKDRKPKIAQLQRQHESQVEIAKVEHKKWKEAVAEALKDGSKPPQMPSAAEIPGLFVVPRLYLSSVTIERIPMLLAARPSGLLVIYDELAGLFLNTRRYSGGQDNEFWLEAWNGGHYVVERVGRPPVEVNDLLVGITGGFQPDKLARSFDGDADGMYARICFGWPEEPMILPKSSLKSSMHSTAS
jgi:hypothetical protein